jgi:hypothetical protein
MNTILRKSAIAASLVLALAVSAFKASANENKLVYEKELNPNIGITIEHADNTTYAIKDKNGKIIAKGVVKGKKTIVVSTSNLSGEYKFEMGNKVVQEFVVK